MQHILLVEDSPDDVDIVRKTLEKHCGHPEVTHCPSMAEAEAHLDAHKESIGLILLDLGLPDTKNGRDTFGRMRKYAGEIPIVILTGMEDHELALSLVRDGAEDFVNKRQLLDKPESLRDVLEFAACRHQLIGDTHKKHQENLKDKDMVISWMSGDYSMKK